MNAKQEQTGRCLCGKVSYTISEPVTEVGACHCDMCRRWTGGPFLALHCAADTVSFDGESEIGVFNSSEWAARGFCKSCGSNLYYHLTQSGEMFLLAGTLDDQTGLALTGQVFIEEKPAFYDFANETKNMTGAELFAMYAPEDGSEKG